MVSKVSKRISVIRGVCYGMHVYFFAAALTGLAATFAVTQVGIHVETMVSVIVGAAVVSILAMIWLLSRQQEIFRFRTRLERQKRDDDHRDRQLKDIAEKESADKGDGDPRALRASSAPTSNLRPGATLSV